MARDELIAQAFADERVGTARLVLRFRVIAGLAWLLADCGFALAGNHDSRLQVPIIAAFVALAAAFAVVAKDRPALSWWALALLDLPAITIIDLIGLPVAPVPIVEVTIATGLYVLVIFLTELSMRASNVLIATTLGCVGQSILFARIGALRMAPFYLIVLLLSGLLATFRLQRGRVLLERIAREQRLRRYFSPEIAQDIIAAGDARRAARRCDVTVLILDVRDFTALAEAEGDRIIATLDELLGAMVAILFAKGGTLDKFTGDGLLAYFGAPIARADHAAAAVACAGEMQGALARVNEARKARGESALRIGIGLHSGPVVVGDLGPEARREFTAIGDTVNVAARIESLTKQHGAPVLASAETRRLAGEEFTWTAAPPSVIKGKAEPIETFAPTGFGSARSASG